MPVYAKKVQSSSPRFQDRAVTVAYADRFRAGLDVIPVPDDVVLCNGCNSNITEMEEPEGYLIYLGKRELQQDRPYDIYCPKCLRDYFPKAIIVEG